LALGKKGGCLYISISTFPNVCIFPKFDDSTIALFLTSTLNKTPPKKFNHLSEIHKKIIPFKVE
jgi:hypothetical protein